MLEYFQLVMLEYFHFFMFEYFQLVMLKYFQLVMLEYFQVRDKQTGQLLQNITADKPSFLVTDLPPLNWLAGLNLTV